MIEKFSGFYRNALVFLDPSLTILYFVIVTTVSYFCIEHIFKNKTHILSSGKVVCLVFTLTVKWVHEPCQASIVHMRKLRHRQLVTCGDQYYYYSAIA